MILITKDEAKYIQKHYKDIPIAITCRNKNSKRKRYFCEEGKRTYELLNQYYEELREGN